MATESEAGVKLPPGVGILTYSVVKTRPDLSEKKAPPFPLRAEKEGHLYEDKQGVFLGLAGLAPQAREALMSI